MELPTSTPPPQELPHPSPTTVITIPPIETSSEADEEDDNNPTEQEEWVKKMRGWLMILAVLAASVTYQAGLNPPGGFWQDDSQSSNITMRHSTGNPVLANTSPVRYGVFVAFNASAFVTSLFIIGLLLKKSFFHEELRLDLLRNFLIGNNICLIVAFAVGSSHELKGPGLVIITIFGSILHIKWKLWKSGRKLVRRSPVREEGDA